MKVIVLPNNLYQESDDREFDKLCRSERRWMTVLFISGIFGAGSGLLGLFLGGLTWIGVSDSATGIGHISNWLIAFFLPLMVLAAHALDKAGEARKAIRIARCKKYELRNEEC
jgi:hypothetical protein